MTRQLALLLYTGVSLLLLNVPIAIAAPITLTKSNAVAPARTDPGAGMCGSATHFKTPASPVSAISDAVVILDKPIGDASVLGRKTGLFSNMNFRNADPSSTGDFTAPSFVDALFPYSADPKALPPGDNNNLALRLRGYLNVTDTLSGQPVTFGINCDDACSLTIGQQAIFSDTRFSSRVTRQVIFQDTGLYPVEIVYYQNASQGYLEWSRALTAEPEGTRPDPLDTSKYKLISATDLYSAVVGSSSDCQQCGAPGMDCASGNFCGNGICQICNTASHCGATCQTCPASDPICSAGACVECLSDAMCPAGLLCGVDGRCVAPTPCRVNADCTSQNRICDSDTRTCQPIPLSCVGLCQSRYDGGTMGGCSTTGRHRGVGEMGLLAFALLGLLARRRRIQS